MTGVHATPFHARAAGLNLHNAWTTRNGFTLAAEYGDARDEALAARTRVAMADISWRCRTMVEGTRAAEFLSRLVTRDAARLEPGQSFKALWLNDGGAVRGAGLIARFGRESFLVAASAPDREWFSAAAQRFDVQLRDVTFEEGGLGLIGPYAQSILQDAGLDTALEPLCFRKLFWRGLDVTLSRWGEHGGYELWCRTDDAVIAWDRIAKPGSCAGIAPAGLSAMDLLDIEAGVARPGRDWQPASDGFATVPTPSELGLESLIDPEHTGFNGRAAWLAARQHNARTIAGVEIDSNVAAPFTPLLRNGAPAGHTMSSAYSPALRRAIALVRLDVSAAETGTVLSLVLPPSREIPELRAAKARVVALPFLSAPELAAARTDQRPD